MRKITCMAFLLFCGGGLVARSAPATALLPTVEKTTDALLIRVTPPTHEDDFFLYYRTEGLDRFQVRKMDRDDGGGYAYRLRTENLYGKDIEYMVLPKGQSFENSLTPIFTIVNFSTQAFPEVYFLDDETTAAAATPTPQEPFLGVSSSVSAASRLADNADPPGEDFTANGNLRLFKNVFDQNQGFDFESQFSYLNPVSEGETDVNLTSMMVRFKKDQHKVEVGDVSVNQSEFTTSYLQRRGLNYEFAGKTIYMNSFYTNSQQRTGFDGFGIPDSDANIFGAVAGFNLSQTAKVRALFMTGQDTVDSKTVSISGDPFRKGNMMSFFGDFSLLKNAVQLRGEYARSKFGSGPDDTDPEQSSDSAWLAGTTITYKFLTLTTDYKKVGTNFNSIANLFLQNDRQGLTSSMNILIKAFTFNVSFMDEKSYLDNPDYPTQRTRNLTTDIGYTIANRYKIGAKYGFDNTNYDEATGLQQSGSDMDTLNYGVNFGLVSGMNSVNLDIGKKESKTFTSAFSAALSMNLQLGKAITFMPMFSYDSTKSLADNETTKTYNASLNSAVTLVQQWLTLNFSGSYYKSGDMSKRTDAGVNLDVDLSKLFKNKVRPVLSFRSRYQNSDYSGTVADSFSLYLQVDIAY